MTYDDYFHEEVCSGNKPYRYWVCLGTDKKYYYGSESANHGTIHNGPFGSAREAEEAVLQRLADMDELKKPKGFRKDWYIAVSSTAKS